MSAEAVEKMTVRNLLTMMAEVELGARNRSKSSATIPLLEKLSDELLDTAIDEVDTLTKRAVITGAFYIIADGMGFSRKLAAVMAVEMVADLLQAAGVERAPENLEPLIIEVGMLALHEMVSDDNDCDCDLCTERRRVVGLGRDH